MQCMSRISMTNKIKEPIGFHYLFTEDLLKKIKDISITHDIFRIQSDDSIIYCLAFIDLMIAEKTLLDYTNLFSPNDYQKMKRYIKDI